MKPVVSLVASALLATLALIWIIYFNPFQIEAPAYLRHLPLLNAIFNICSAICLVGGLYAILRKKPAQHRVWMLTAFLCSTLFLVSYITHHTLHGDTPFLQTGWIRGVYFFILISHISLSILALPLILITFYWGLSQRFPLHKKLARWTWPIWFYVSVTGVLVYVML